MNFEASTFRKGLPLRRARRRAISVFPTPVGPIMRMFFGVTSAATSGGRRCRRMRLRRAMATAFLAARLADDEAVELGHDLARGEPVEGGELLAGSRELDGH